MARIDFLVDGVKCRFVLSTATSDSIFPKHLVPSGCLVQNAEPRLFDVVGNEIDISGSYQAVLESPNVDFRVAFTMIATEGKYPVLGNDFLRKVRMQSMIFSSEGNYLDAVNQNGAIVRLPITMQTGPEDDGCYLLPAVNRLPTSEPTSSTSNGAQQRKRRSKVTENVVFFHLETTGFGTDAEIIQIAAAYRGKMFNEYILPDGDIHPKAMEKNGFLKSGDVLYLRGQAVSVTARQLAAQGLLAFLRDVGGNVILAAHNACPFHAPLLRTLLASLGLTGQFESQVRGLADTLPLFRRALPDRDSSRQSFSLEDLAKDLLKEQVPFHGAEGTVATLEKLLKKVRIGYKEVIKSSKPLTEFPM